MTKKGIMMKKRVMKKKINKKITNLMKKPKINKRTTHLMKKHKNQKKRVKPKIQLESLRKRKRRLSSQMKTRRVKVRHQQK